MANIYNTNGFNYIDVMNEISQVAEEIDEERKKNDNEYDREKDFKLLYKQFMLGLKLNTGVRLF